MSLDAADSPASIHQLGPGQPFATRLLLIDKQRLLSRNSKAYLALMLRDRDGEIQGRAFREEARAALETIEPGTVLEVSGRTQSFHGQPQIDIFNARKAEGAALHANERNMRQAVPKVVPNGIFQRDFPASRKEKPCGLQGLSLYGSDGT